MAKPAREQHPERKIIATNRRAKFEYHVLETLEAGIVLFGPEVKSLREGRANLGDAYGLVKRGELFLDKLHISPYAPAMRANTKPQRERKLLVHRREIKKLLNRVRERGVTIVPLSLYFNEDGRVKVEMALVRGKQEHDKRETLKRRETDRDARRVMSRQVRSRK